MWHRWTCGSGPGAAATIATIVIAAGAGAGVAAPAAQAAGFSGSSITAPAAGAELFYDADSGSGSIAVSGTVTPATAGGSGDLLCYSAPGSTPFTVFSGIAVRQGSFSAEVSLQPIASRACRLRLVPHGAVPGAGAASAFAGPQVSVSERATDSAGGNVYGYYILSGTLPWSYAFGSLGECPVLASYATDTATLGSYLLFDGNACLLRSSGTAPEQGTRSGVQVDGLNAYAPAALSSLTGVPGFSPLSYTAGFDTTHDTVTIGETDALDVCASPGGYPPTTGSCPSLSGSGIRVSQTTTLLPGGQVSRVSQTFASIDGSPHSLDLLISQSIAAPAAGETPAFEFPGQPVFARHQAPESYGVFSSGPGSIYVIANAVDAPATSNPIGAITYQRPPSSADFVSSSGAQTATFLMHYAASIPAGGSFTLRWSFAQTTDAGSLTSLVRTERDRFYSPTLTVTAPRNGTTARRSPIVVRGVAHDPIGLSSVSVDGLGAALTSSGSFALTLSLRPGRNLLRVKATNLAGNTTTVERHLTFLAPPCVVPRLRGRTLAAARRALEAHHCKAGRTVRIDSASVRAGRVVSSSPAARARRRYGARVTLRVSRGRARTGGGHHG